MKETPANPEGIDPSKGVKDSRTADQGRTPPNVERMQQDLLEMLKKAADRTASQPEKPSAT